jgi:predicted DNA-binding transcriptional regulator AlpA
MSAISTSEQLPLFEMPEPASDGASILNTNGAAPSDWFGEQVGAPKGTSPKDSSSENCPDGQTLDEPRHKHGEVDATTVHRNTDDGLKPLGTPVPSEDAAETGMAARRLKRRRDRKAAKDLTAGAKANRPPDPQSGRQSRYLGVRKVAERYDRSVPTVWRWAKEDPDFPKPHKIGRSTLWSLSELEDYERKMGFKS